MSNYATAHHPQVQARKLGQLALNCYRRERYVAVLVQLGHVDAKRLTKTEAFVRVKNSPEALALLYSQ